MNYYILVEGECVEPAVYKTWIRFLNPKLKPINYISEYIKNNYLIFSGKGYPNYLNTIVEACKTVLNNKIIDNLVIAVDSEEMSFNEKKEEIENIIKPYANKMNYKIIIQHFCIETWALGNLKIIKRNPQDTELRSYIKHFDVKNQDPENMPNYPKKYKTKAQFAYRYLKKTLYEKNQIYSKSSPKVLCNKKYYKQVKKRYEVKRHIQSFDAFINAFK